MKLGDREKDEDMFRRLLNISDKSFDGYERPPERFFKAHFTEDDVFVDSTLAPNAFAIVYENRDGRYLWSIAVISGLRKNGLGTELLKEIEGYYRPMANTTQIELSCKVDNWQAQRVYLKMGYRVVRVLPRYYGSEDGLLMRRVL